MVKISLFDTEIGSSIDLLVLTQHQLERHTRALIILPHTNSMVLVDVHKDSQAKRAALDISRMFVIRVAPMNPKESTPKN